MDNKKKEDAPDKNKSLIEKIFFGENIFSIVLGWIIFIAAMALLQKIVEVVFGCMNEYGIRYSC